MAKKIKVVGVAAATIIGIALLEFGYRRSILYPFQFPGWSVGLIAGIVLTLIGLFALVSFIRGFNFTALIIGIISFALAWLVIPIAELKRVIEGDLSIVFGAVALLFAETEVGAFRIVRKPKWGKSTKVGVELTNIVRVLYCIIAGIYLLAFGCRLLSTGWFAVPEISVSILGFVLGLGLIIFAVISLLSSRDLAELLTRRVYTLFFHTIAAIVIFTFGYLAFPNPGIVGLLSKPPGEIIEFIISSRLWFILISISLMFSGVGFMIDTLRLPGQVKKIERIENMRKERDVDGLIRALRGKDSSVCTEAAKALGRIGDETAVEALTKALRDKNSGVRKEVKTALKKIRRRAKEKGSR